MIIRRKNMDISPIKLMQMKGKLNRFQNAHPKLVPFLNAASARMEEGSIFAITVTSPDGSKIETNLKLSKEDVEFLKEAAELSRGTF